MPLPGIGSPIKATSDAISWNLWCLEWTYTDGIGAVLLDSAKSDLDSRVATPVADGGSGITSIRFPKCKTARVIYQSIEPATPGTFGNYRQTTVSLVVPASGSLDFRMIAANGGALSDPESGSRGRLVLLLDY